MGKRPSKATFLIKSAESIQIQFRKNINQEIPDFGVRNSFGGGNLLRIADCGLPIADCGLKSRKHCRFQIEQKQRTLLNSFTSFSHFRLKIAAR